MSLVTSARKDQLLQLSTAALVGGTSGLVAAISVLPSAVRATLLLLFVGVGPGAALLQFCSGSLIPVVRRALVPVAGVSVVICVVSVSLLLGYWSPRTTLLALATVTFAAGAWDHLRVGRAAR